MNKKWLFGILLIITILTIVFIILIKGSVRYNKLVIDEDEWNSIIDNKEENTYLSFNSIEFNDYELIIDEKNSTIYYSVVNNSKKYNPSVKYKVDNNIKIAFNSTISDDIVDVNNKLKILLYNDKEYRIYYLVVTNYPILNVNYKNDIDKKNSVDIELEIFDNHIDIPNRVLKSDGRLRIIEENKEYSFSLRKESLGRNERENHISIFGMDKRDEYLIKVTDNINNKEKYVQFFINNEYKGLYSFGPNNGRINNFERNRQNNR